MPVRTALEEAPLSSLLFCSAVCWVAVLIQEAGTISQAEAPEVVLVAALEASVVAALEVVVPVAAGNAFLTNIR